MAYEPDDSAALKHIFDVARIDKFAADTKAVWPRFDADAFRAHALAGLDDLGIMQRMRQIASAYDRTLPDDYDMALGILRDVAPTIQMAFAGIVLSFSFLWLVLNQLGWTIQYMLSNLALGAPLLDLSTMVVVGASVIATGLILVSPWVLAVYFSHEIGKKKFSIGELPATLVFLLFYGTVISFFYCISFFKEVNRSDYRWK